MCGSTLVRFYDPEVVQARGGASYDRWFALPHHLGEGERIEQSVEHGKIEDRLDYIIGASLLASRRMVTDIGLMSEDYFLYFEDLDWALRARGQYDLAYASTSIVYHVEGASTGGNASPTDRPLTSDYYWLRNRLRISARYYPYALPTVILACIGSVIRRILSGRPAHAGRLVKLLATQAWRKPPVPEALEGCGTEGRSP